MARQAAALGELKAGARKERGASHFQRKNLRHRLLAANCEVLKALKVRGREEVRSRKPIKCRQR